uniref:Coat protein n=1 Tax=Romanomermis culicivorax TaxID=13658 RepID=A0A915LA36_ROMCU
MNSRTYNYNTPPLSRRKGPWYGHPKSTWLPRQKNNARWWAQTFDFLHTRSVDFLEPPTAANVATAPKNVDTRWLGWPCIAQTFFVKNTDSKKTVNSTQGFFPDGNQISGYATEFFMVKLHYCPFD